MTLSSDDEYGADFPVLTQDDLDAIDALSAPPLAPTVVPSPPVTTTMYMRIPLLARYRANRPMSVTDFTSPLWCEYQWVYSLMGNRHLPLRLRPQKLQLPSGREIKVDQERAQVGDKIMKAGSKVHKKLELEIHPVQIQIRTQNAEEAMALKLANMFGGVRSLLEQGYTREFPVFGFLHNQQIIGIIDEIRRTPRPSSSSSPSSQRSILSFFSLSPAKSSSPRPTHTLRLLDAKTRLTPSVPPPESTTALSARLQLMLYKSLLDPILSISPAPFDFSAYFLSVGLDEDQVFTDEFLAALFAMVESGVWDVAVSGAKCLADLVRSWPAAVRRLGADGTEDTMEIIYRLQAKRIQRRRRPAQPSTPDVVPSPVPVRERSDTDRSPSPEVGNSRSMPGAFDGTSDASFSRSSQESDAESELEDQILQMVMKESLQDEQTGQELEVQTTLESALRTPASSRTVAAPTPISPKAPPEAEEGSDILGTQSFTYSQVQLDAHIEDMLQMWKGERDLRGVSVEDAVRCWRCPYQDGCEWREVKANYRR